MILTLGGDFEHWLAEVKAGRVRAALCEREREVARAAAQIESAITRLDLRQPDDVAFPKPVQAETLEVIDQIVTPGDGGEKVIDLGGALFASIVEDIAHADSLAHGGGWKSQSRRNTTLRHWVGFVTVARLNCPKRMNHR